MKHTLADEATILDPAQFLRSGSRNDDAALIILNSPITSFDRFAQLYRHSRYIVCADGGANRLYDLLTDKDIALSKFQPTAVHGDLDSITDEVRRAYTSIGIPVTQDRDQYSTDFQKALKKVSELGPVQDILVLGSTGGRVDQGIGLLHELYREQCFRRTTLRFWLYTEGSVSLVLPEGLSRVDTCVGDGIITRNMGILPIYGEAVISTHGLEWDVQKWTTAMGGNVSTSNHIMQDQIEILTTNAVLLSVELVNR